MSDVKRYTPRQAADRLSELLGFEITAQRLENWRRCRAGPTVDFFNNKPIYSDPNLVAFARAALKPQPPIKYRFPRGKP